ncbi:MAG: hypothetical protein R3C44_24720 [Chloroflexota bacterium]
MGSALATTLSIHVGFRLTLLAATLVYAVAAVLFSRAVASAEDSPVEPTGSNLSELQPT